MLELHPQTRVAEVEAASPAMMQALRTCGIFRPGDDTAVTIDELCFSFGLNPAFLLQTLESARAKEQPPAPEALALEGLSLTEVVENIERVHHDYLRSLLPDLGARLAEVAKVHGSQDARLIEAQGLFQHLAADLENHLRHEEEALFKMVREMEAAGGISPTRCGSAVGGPIACMENEHDMARDVLARLRELTDQYMVPDHACDLYRGVVDDLRRFDADMAVHMVKEDQVLFPRALQAQRELRT